MARISGKDAIYEVADSFRNRCLSESRSLLWPDATAWTPENLAQIWEAVIENPDRSDRGFFEKWEDQLADLGTDVHRTAADVMVLYHLYPTVSRPETKLDQVRTVIGWKVQEEPPALDSVERAFAAEGIGHPGTYYLTNKYLQVGFYSRFAEELQRRGVDPHSPGQCKDLAIEIDNEQLPQRAVAGRYILLHLLFPEDFERSASEEQRRKIISTYEEHAGEYSDTHEALANIRETLVEEEGREDFDFYDEDIWNEWDPDRKSEDESKELEDEGDEAATPRFWIEKTKVEGRPHREEGKFALGKVLWSPRRDKRGADIYRFMREVEPGDIVLHLTDNEAFTGLSRVASEYQDFEGIEGTEWGYGPSYLVELEDFRRLDPPLSRDVFFDQPYDKRLLELREGGKSNLFYTSDPELRQGAYLTPAPVELVNILNDAYESIAGNLLVAEVPRASATDSPQPVKEERTLDWLQKQTLWPRTRLEELVEDLEDSSPQVVLAGPPGTSKTWVAKHVAEYLTNGRSERHRIVQFHPSYGYEDFIEGLRPVSDEEGGISFQEERGVLLEMTKEMRDNDREDETHVLVIDEMNRANLPRVFGELMYLFEYRGEGEEIQLQYTEDFSLPMGLKFIATMNTADRSIRSIDIALRRRFDVFECMPDTRVIRRYYAQDGHNNEVERLIDGIEELNDRLTEEIDRHHQIGHTFFMEPTMTRRQLRKIWDRKLAPLIEEYFFDQPDIAAEYTLEEFWSES